MQLNNEFGAPSNKAQRKKPSDYQQHCPSYRAQIGANNFTALFFHVRKEAFTIQGSTKKLILLRTDNDTVFRHSMEVAHNEKTQVTVCVWNDRNVRKFKGA